jgi:hypothetical protein
MITRRLRRSEWWVLYMCMQSAGTCRITRRGASWSPVDRCIRRGLIARGPQEYDVQITSKGRDAYAHHPINWGLPGGPANCH